MQALALPIWQSASMSLGQVMLIARFAGDVDELKAAYDRAHDLIMRRGGAVPIGELRHHCAASDDSLYIIGFGSRKRPSAVDGRARSSRTCSRR